jgi:PmbA protein
MLDRIINVLKASKDISDWKLVQKITESNELFLVRKAIHMPRSKKVNNILVTVYKDFEDNGKKFRGSSTVKIAPTMTDEEITSYIKDAAFAASFVKNEYYPLPAPSSSELNTVETKFDNAELSEWMPKIKDALYKNDTYTNGYINSTEIFLDKNDTTIINSRGINKKFRSYNGHIEFITGWKEEGEEIELYKELKFSDFDGDYLASSAREMLEMSREKAATKPTPNLGNFTVILNGEPVAELLKHYYVQSDAENVYQHLSIAKLNESIQGADIKGDKINMALDPAVQNSAVSVPVDKDGIVLDRQEIIKNGVLQKYWGTAQYCHYLNIEPTGEIRNMVFEGGSKTINEMRNNPHLEIAAFSDFQLNPMTGDFAGEIRLGWYFDGTTRTVVSGGSISGSLSALHNNIYLSKEMQQCSARDAVFQPLHFTGPKAVMLYGVTVAGS